MNNYRYKKCCQLQDNMNIVELNEENTTDRASNCSNNIQTPEYNCNCGFDEYRDSLFPENPMLGQSYVPIQTMKKIFNPETGLKMGTIFPELASEYYPCQGIRDINYLSQTNEIGEGCNK